jgi:hypothetical protein
MRNVLGSVPSFGMLHSLSRIPTTPKCEAAVGLRRYLDGFAFYSIYLQTVLSQNWSEFWTANKNLKIRAALCSRLQRAQG